MWITDHDYIVIIKSIVHIGGVGCLEIVFGPHEVAYRSLPQKNVRTGKTTSANRKHIDTLLEWTTIIKIPFLEYIEVLHHLYARVDHNASTSYNLKCSLIGQCGFKMRFRENN